MDVSLNGALCRWCFAEWRVVLMLALEWRVVPPRAALRSLQHPQPALRSLHRSNRHCAPFTAPIERPLLLT